MIMPIEFNELPSQIHRCDADELLNKLNFFLPIDDPPLPSPTSSTTSPESSEREPSPPPARPSLLRGRGGSSGTLTDEYRPTPPPLPGRKSTSERTLSTIGSSVFSSRRYLSVLDSSTQHKEPLSLEPELMFQQDKKIQFFPQATVVNIPAHQDYPKKMRRSLWSSLEEIQINGERNSIEFEADSQDWRKAKEEDDFVTLDGSLYHPETFRLLKASGQLKRRKKSKKKKKGNIKKKRTGVANPSKTNTSSSSSAQPKEDKKKKWGKLRFLRGKPSLTRFADT